jgi:DNA polymerase I
MKIYTFHQSPSYPICFLLPTIMPEEIRRWYLNPVLLDPASVMMARSWHTGKKTPVSEIKRYIIEELAPTLEAYGTQYVMVSDGDYFKQLAKVSRIDLNLGYVLDSPYGSFKVIYIPNHRAIFYDPEKNKAQIAQAMEALRSHAEGTYEDPGTSAIQGEHYPKSISEIAAALEHLLRLDVDLAIDIEGFSLKHWSAGIGTIAFSWNQGEGIAFAVDYQPIPEAEVVDGVYGRRVYNEPVRQLLRGFFEAFAKTGRKSRWHNIAYDVYVLVAQLFMKHLLDTEGLLYGLKVMLGPDNQDHWDCTKLISYLATNSCAGNHLSLKAQSQEFAGNYGLGEELKDITKIPLPKLLRYNLIDSLATNYVFDKNYPILIADDQKTIYETVFKPATRDIIQMQLTGLPVDMQRVKEVKLILEAAKKKAVDAMQVSSVVAAYIQRRNHQWVVRRNIELKKKRVTLADAKETFNPGSAPQLQELLYEMVGLPVIARTDSKLPSTEADVLKALKAHTTDPEVLSFLDELLDFKSVYIILNTFIPALEGAQQGPDGWYYLFGNFNLGGTLSGRLSSSDPNLQNLPATSKYAKLIKTCIVAPPGWIFVGIDFKSLEDMISALTTRDPAKLKVYLDGFDGHCLRAFAYFREQMPDIIDGDVPSINSIATKYKALRQMSKDPTFALTYQGTYHTLMANCGFSEEKAQLIEKRYHDLYQVSDAWVANKLDMASRNGYITAAFGLRVRTPLLAQVIRGNSKTPHEAQAEGRTAGNALGQSWCLLNSRAGSEFLQKVRSSEYRLDIKPCAQIHDAQYYMVRENPYILTFLNTHLVDAVRWQNHPDIWHDEVKLGGEVSVFYPTWCDEISIPNGADVGTIIRIIEEHTSP